MLSRNRLIVLLASFFTLCTLPAAAQEFITVSGTVLTEADKTDVFQSAEAGKPITSCDVKIYGYNTIEEATEKLKILQKLIKERHVDDFPQFSGFVHESQYNVDTGEYSSISIPSNGAILFFLGSNDFDPKLVRVKGRTRINVTFNVAIQLQESRKVETTRRPTPKKPTVRGNTLDCGMTYPFPREKMGKSTARFAVQTYVLDYNNPMREGLDTIEYHYPIVLDGMEYHNTQIRRKGFDDTRDPLLGFADTCSLEYGWLTDTTSIISWNDSYYLSSQEDFVKIQSRLWFEDYNRIYYTETLEIADSRRVSRPMRFLDYDTHSFSIDMTVPPFARVPRQLSMSDESKLDLKFAVGSAKVDEKDSTSVAQLNTLLQTLQGFDDASQGCQMNQIQIFGQASPEGSYAKNQVLASQRMDYIREKIKTIIRRPLYIGTQARVATWAQLADTLAAESFETEAEAIRAIVEKYPNNLDAQGPKIRALPYYNSIISPRLEKLRSVRVMSDYSVLRIKTDAEVLNDYRANKDNKKARIPDYEYVALFRMIDKGIITDAAEQEEIYRRAVRDARAAKSDRDRNWQLPENRLAQFLIAQGKPDTTLLAKHVDENYISYYPGSDNIKAWCDRPLDGNIVNPSPLVANQVVMMLKAGQYERAGELAPMLRYTAIDNPDYLSVYYIARCLAGFFEDDSDQGAREELYDAICNTSPRNNFVINLAMGNFSLAEAALEDLNPDDPVTHYLTAQFICQNNYRHGCRSYIAIPSDDDKEIAVKELAKAFRMDPKLIPIAQSDIDIFEDLAKLAYEESKKEEEPEEEEIVVPAGLKEDGLGGYYDSKGNTYYYEPGRGFVDVITDEIYQAE